MSLDPERFDRAFGTMLGQVAGDSLGAQVEFSSASSINSRYPKGVREMVGGGPHGILAGQATDDSELALGLARSLALHGDWIEEDVASAYVDWKQSHPFDCGGTCGNAFGWVDMKRPIAKQVKENAQRALGSEANGGLMRISPLGVLFAGKLWGFNKDKPENSLDKLIAQARGDALLSHANERCQIANAVYTLTIAETINGDFARRPDERAIDSFRFALRLAKSDHFPECEAKNFVIGLLEGAQSRPVKGETADSQQGWFAHGFQNAFFQLRTAPSFEEGVVRTISLGGDTDTNAAISGPLLGALWGAKGIPSDWKDKVLKCKTDRPSTYHADDLEDLTKKILYPEAE
jgi:ADP-ribosylglycohydrolase